MNTKFQAVASGVREAAALLAVALVPVVANYYSFRIYEPDKNAILVTLMLLALLAGLAVVGEGYRAGSTRPVSALLRQPMVVGAILLALVTCLSVFFAPLAPMADRLFGASERSLGLTNLLACLVLFAAVATSARSADTRARVVAALILGSLPVSLVAILQGLGVYLVQTGSIESTTRAFGTLANPIFMAAYLMMVLPLTLIRLGAAKEGGRRVGLGLILVAQLAALWFSASRGPQAGLIVGLATLAIGWGIVSGRRKLAWGTVGLVVFFALFVGLFNMPGSPLAPLRTLPVIGRFGQIGDVGQGSQATRMAIWRATSSTLAADPQALLLGHGPESLKYALLRQGHAALGQGSEAERLVDRGHNVVLDQLTTTGLPGTLALLLVYIGWLLAAAQAAGLTPEPGSRRTLAGLLVAGTLIGALGWFVPAAAPYAGATTLLGMAAGLGVYLVLTLVRHRDDESAIPPEPLALALLAIGAAVVVEAATGIQTVATQAIFWALAGLTLALTWPRAAVETTTVPLPRAAARSDAGTVTLNWSPVGGGLGLVGAAVASSLSFTYFVRGVVMPTEILALVITLIVLSLAGGAVLAADAGAGAAGFALTAIPVWLIYLGMQWLTLKVADAAMLWPVTVFWYLALALLAGWWLRPTVAAKTEAVRGVMAGVYVIAAIVVSTAVFLMAVRPVQAAIYFQSATAYFGQLLTLTPPKNKADADAATTAAQLAGDLFDRATNLDSSNDTYYSLWSEMYTRLGTTTQNQTESLTAFDAAQKLIANAEVLDPNMPYHKFNRGHLQLVAIDRMPAEQRAAVAANAVVPLQEAFDAIKGTDPQLVNELALAKLLSNDFDGALALVDYSRKLAPDRMDTLALQGRVLASAGKLPEAKATMEEAIAKGVKDPQLLIALAEVTRQTGDSRAAVNYYRQAVETGQITDWRIFFNMGLLYRDLDEFAEAAQSLQLASRLAPAEEQATIQEAIDGLVNNKANPDVPQMPGNPAPGQPGSPFILGTPTAP